MGAMKPNREVLDYFFSNGYRWYSCLANQVKFFKTSQEAERHLYNMIFQMKSYDYRFAAKGYTKEFDLRKDLDDFLNNADDYRIVQEV